MLSNKYIKNKTIKIWGATIFVFCCLGFWPLGFGFFMGLPPPPTVRCGSFTRRGTTATLLGGSRPAPPGSFCFYFVFLVLDQFLYCSFCVLVFLVFSTALPIFSASDLPPSVHYRAFPRDPTATSSNTPCTSQIRLLRDWLFPVLLVFSVCILLLFPCIAVFCL
jgi:hypothetical protein